MTPTRGGFGPSLTTLSGLLLAQCLVGLTGTLVITALPSIRADLGMSLTESTWLVTATILANSATTPLWGAFGDRVHRRNVLLTALGLFLFGTVCAAVAGHTFALFAARAIQGAGIGGITVMATAIAAQLVVPRHRARINAWLINTQMIMMFVGPLVGGALSQSTWGWRAAFVFQAPVALVSIALVTVGLRHMPAVERAPRAHLNYTGAATFPAAIAFSLAAVSIWSEGAPSGLVATYAGAAAVTLSVALVSERRSRNPVLPLSIVRLTTARRAFLAAFLVGLTLFSSSVYASQYAQIELGLSPLEAGLALTPTAAGMAITTLIAARHLERTGDARTIVLFGVAGLVIGYAALAAVTTAPLPLLAFGMALVGAGTATVHPNLILIVQNAAAQKMTSAAGGLVIFGQTLGGAAGVALSSVIVEQLSARADFEAEHSIPALYMVYAAIAVVAFVVVLRIRITPLRDTLDLPEPVRG